jgi:hypothetical protein
MLRCYNTLVAPAGASHARLTMNFKMDTLYSTFAVPRFAYPLALCSNRAERGARIKRMFHDVFWHFHRWSVAKRRHLPNRWIVVAVALVAGCAGVGGLSADAPAAVKNEAVAERAKARWQRLIDRDLAGAYEYLSPASRETMPLDLYKAKHKVGMYRSVNIDGVDCQADTCTVKLSLTYDYKKIKGVTTPLEEKWIITQGQAWFVDRG